MNNDSKPEAVATKTRKCTTNAAAHGDYIKLK